MTEPTPPTPLADLSDKITIACAAIKTALDALKTDGYFKVVVADVINPFKIQQRPALGIVPARWQRSNTIWTCEVLLMVVAQAEGAKPADAVGRVLGGLIEEKLDALDAAGTAGCIMAKPLWDPWYDRPMSESPLAAVGSLGNLTITVDHPILVRPTT